LLDLRNPAEDYALQKRRMHYWRDRMRKYRREHAEQVRRTDYAAWHRNKAKYLARQRLLRAAVKIQRAAQHIARRDQAAALFLREIRDEMLSQKT
jgi:hypothetical protein